MNSQFKKGVLNMCVLTVLSKGDSYGYDLAYLLSSKIEISEGTVYPILRKLSADGLVSAYLKESKEGPPRKYYRLEDKGKEELKALKDEWFEFTKAVRGILEEYENE